MALEHQCESNGLLVGFLSRFTYYSINYIQKSKSHRYQGTLWHHITPSQCWSLWHQSRALIKKYQSELDRFKEGKRAGRREQQQERWKKATQYLGSSEPRVSQLPVRIRIFVVVGKCSFAKRLVISYMTLWITRCSICHK